MSDHLNRRAFTRGLVVTAAAAVTAIGEDSPKKPDEKNESKPPEEPAPVKEAVRPPEELILDLVKQQYPDPRLDEEALEEIRRDVRRQLSRSTVLSTFPLSNADEPAFVFAAYPPPPSKEA